MVSVRSSVYGVEQGKTYGTRKVIGRPFSRGPKRWAVVVHCHCGRVSIAWCNNLSSGKSDQCRSCQVSKRNTIHGESRTRLHSIWCNMHQRCNDEKHTAYQWYGGRGIRVCEEWDSYVAFRDWAMANGYTDDLTIDRDNPNGNYEPGNCQWMTNVENAAKMHRQKKMKRVA